MYSSNNNFSFIFFFHVRAYYHRPPFTTSIHPHSSFYATLHLISFNQTILTNFKKHEMKISNLKMNGNCSWTWTFRNGLYILLPTIQRFAYENVIHSFLLFTSNLHSTGNCELYAHKFVTYLDETVSTIIKIPSSYCCCAYTGIFLRRCKILCMMFKFYSNVLA